MTFASGNLIQATDYNALAGTLRAQLGVGTSSRGLGQDVSTVLDVAAGNTVTATQWTNLIAKTNAVLTHEGQATISPGSVIAGNPITAYSAITTGVNAAYNNTGQTALAKSDGTTNTSGINVAWGSGGDRALIFNHTVTFASGDAARYFFNAGGSIRITCGKSGGSSTRNDEWAALCAAFGTINIGYNNTTKIGGSGSCTLLNANNGGYWNMSGTLNQHAIQYDTAGGYTSNFIQVAAYWSGSPSNGGYPVLNIRTYWSNGSGTAGLNNVNGDMATYCWASNPSTSQLTNTWGTPSISAAAPIASSGTVTIGASYFVYTPTLSGNQNYNVNSAASVAGWNGSAILLASIYVAPTAIVYASSTANYAFTLNATALPVGSYVRVVNAGYIMGYGGAGSAGGATGGAGGHAIYAGTSMTMDNRSYIAGGGGGGGGTIYSPYTSGGGGGAGYPAGAGGAASFSGSAGYFAGGSGTAGSPYLFRPGTGYYNANMGFYGGAPPGYSGNGGAPGAAGASGVQYPYGGYQGAGGAAGYYAIGNGNISWTNAGYRAGNVG